MHKFVPSKFYFINSFKKDYIDKLDSNTGIIYRNYNNKVNLKEIIKIKDYCSRKKITFFISNNFRLSLRLNLDGAYIPSFNKSFRHLSYKIKTGFLILGSAHNIKEIRMKENQGVEIIFLSSVYKKNKNYLGINKFRLLSSLSKKKIIALGGVTKSNLKSIKLLCYGFSGISYFEKKKAP